MVGQAGEGTKKRSNGDPTREGLDNGTEPAIVRMAAAQQVERPTAAGKPARHLEQPGSVPAPTGGEYSGVNDQQSHLSLLCSSRGRCIKVSFISLIILPAQSCMLQMRVSPWPDSLGANRCSRAPVPRINW